MTLKRSSLVALVVTTTLACSGKLNVGKPNGAESDGGMGGSGGSSLASGGGGSSAVAGRAGSGGGGSAAGAATMGGVGGGVTGGAPSGGGGAMGAGTAGVPPCPDFMFPCNTGGVTQEQIDYYESFPKVSAVPDSTGDCPQGPVTPDTECDPPGMICGYRFDGDTQYEECVCAERLTEGAAWHCESSGGSDAVNPCPLAKPEDGADCFGFYGLGCSYPWRIDCECSPDTKQWACVAPLGVPDSLPRLTMPNPDKPVAELTSAERETFCKWSSTMYAGGEGFTPIPDYPVDDEGYVVGSGCTFGDNTFCPASAGSISKGQCLKNLEISECEAPVQELADCLIAVFSECSPETTACIPYLKAPHCSGTMMRSGIGISLCPLKVE